MHIVKIYSWNVKYKNYRLNTTSAKKWQNRINITKINFLYFKFFMKLHGPKFFFSLMCMKQSWIQLSCLYRQSCQQTLCLLFPSEGGRRGGGVSGTPVWGSERKKREIVLVWRRGQKCRVWCPNYVFKLPELYCELS